MVRGRCLEADHSARERPRRPRLGGVSKLLSRRNFLRLALSRSADCFAGLPERELPGGGQGRWFATGPGRRKPAEQEAVANHPPQSITGTDAPSHPFPSVAGAARAVPATRLYDGFRLSALGPRMLVDRRLPTIDHRLSTIEHLRASFCHRAPGQDSVQFGLFLRRNRRI